MDIVFIFLSISVTRQNNARRERERDFLKNLNRLKNVAIETNSYTIKIASCFVDIVLLPSAFLTEVESLSKMPRVIKGKVTRP